MLAPIARKQAAVLRGSSPNNKPRIRVSPSAREPSIKARWEIDLSPGIDTLPLNPDFADPLVSIMRRWCVCIVSSSINAFIKGLQVHVFANLTILQQNQCN
jgi:hypothetical protein